VTTPPLALANITKRYAGVVALENVSFTLRPGTVHALLGENGAGKTTLLRVAYGMTRADGGRIEIDGRPATLRSPADAIALGIGMVHQHFTLVPAMTVAENVVLGGHGLLRREESIAVVREIAAATGFALDPGARVESLTVGAQQRVEIAKALARRARVLVLDEPTAVLAPAEADELLRWLRAFADGGNAAVLITHKLREALLIADDVTVLRHGRVTYTGSARESSPVTLTTAMIGAELAAAPPDHGPRLEAAEPETFRAEQLCLRDEQGVTRLHDANFAVRGGEIVGIVGVEGAGQRELLRALAGRLEATRGVLLRPDSVGFIPEDRHHDAVLLDRTLLENVALRGAGPRRGMTPWSLLRARTASLMRAYDVRARAPDVAMRTLSGGNQQKLVLGRELDAERTAGGVQAIVAENPTRGLDVLATADVHARLRAARDDGAAVVLYSSDLDEVLSLASRVLVVFAGAVREVPANRDLIGRAMLGID
jgi:simple sugar transport system ATP-binding protein